MSEEPIQWLRIVAPHFTAGIKYRGQKCVDGAPILHYVMHMTRTEFLRYCERKKWTVEELESTKPNPTPEVKNG